jgi:hypothetical protein
VPKCIEKLSLLFFGTIIAINYYQIEEESEKILSSRSLGCGCSGGGEKKGACLFPLESEDLKNI